jgi:hypothetical protein
MMRRIVEMRMMKQMLAAAVLLAPACAEMDDATTSNELVVEIDGATAQVGALYRTGDESILITTRRIVTDVTEADGVRGEWYREVDASASAYEVEVTAIDTQRGIRLLARGDQVSLEDNGATAVDKGRAMALFGEAMLALGASDEAIPVAERRLIGQLGDTAATQPGFEDPVLTPLADDQGCWGENETPTISGTALVAKSKAYCGNKGDRKFSLCIRARENRSWAGHAWNVLWHACLGPWCDTNYADQKELGCQETEKYHFDTPAPGTTQFVEITFDRFCSPDGSFGKQYNYEPHLRSVEDFNSWKNFWLSDEWHTLAEGPSVDLMCGSSGGSGGSSSGPGTTPTGG